MGSRSQASSEILSVMTDASFVLLYWVGLGGGVKALGLVGEAAGNTGQDQAVKCLLCPAEDFDLDPKGNCNLLNGSVKGSGLDFNWWSGGHTVGRRQNIFQEVGGCGERDCC